MNTLALSPRGLLARHTPLSHRSSFSPRSAASRFEIDFSVVDLPAPLAPSSATILPFGTSSETPLSTRIT